MRKSTVTSTIPPVEIVIFDMDGVLVDVSSSYRRTIAQTVELYLVEGLGFEKGDRPLVEKKDIALFKRIGGFNNDWDLTTGLLLYFLSLVELRTPEKKARPRTLDEVLQFLRVVGEGLGASLDALRRKKNLEAFNRTVQRRGTGLKAIVQTVGSRYKSLVFAMGDLDHTNLVKRVFQEIYLGPHFQRIHRLSPRFYQGEGMYRSEKLLASRETLERLSQEISLGIASGRPREEARLALERFGIERYFKSLVTLDDIEEEEERRRQPPKRGSRLSKPNPFSIVEAIRQINPTPGPSAYVGDLLDDLEAAHRAKSSIDILAVGCLAPYRSDRDAMRRLFQAHGADLIIEGVDDLLGFIGGMRELLRPSIGRGRGCPESI
jgi:HAD superfamily phosphatase